MAAARTDTRVRLGSSELPNPIVAASGTLSRFTVSIAWIATFASASFVRAR